LTSYAKVQWLLGGLFRNRRFQLRRPRVAGGRYLDIGCGRNTHAELINLDYLWHPRVDVCWNIQRGLPFATGSLRGVYSEHCLEHFPLPAVLQLLREIRRVLAPGGVARLIVPDGEMYLRLYLQHREGAVSPEFPYQAADARAGLWTPMVSVNRIFYQDRESLHGHRTIFDYQLMETALRHSGFAAIQRRSYRQGADSRLLIDSPARREESLYVEAVAPDEATPPAV
jgi:predicted SAM-dependent methyltransferase